MNQTNTAGSKGRTDRKNTSRQTDRQTDVEKGISNGSSSRRGLARCQGWLLIRTNTAQCVRWIAGSRSFALFGRRAAPRRLPPVSHDGAISSTELCDPPIQTSFVRSFVRSLVCSENGIKLRENGMAEVSRSIARSLARSAQLIQLAHSGFP